MPVSRVLAQWSGWSGQPGLSAFHFFDARGLETPTINRVHAFLLDFCGSSGIASLLPNIVQIQVLPTIDTFDEETGDLLATTFGAQPAVIDGTSTANFASPVGVCIAWTTNLIHDVPGSAGGPRRVRGKTFMVPMSSVVFDVDGTVQQQTLLEMNQAVAQFLSVDDDQFVIWSRPVDGAGGAIGPVQLGLVRDKAAILRSRRD